MRYLLFFVLLLAPALSRADDSMPLLYSKTNIMIMRQHPAKMPWQSADDAAPVDPGAMFSTEVRDAASYYNQKGWYNLNAPGDNSAVMLAFSVPTLAPITQNSQYAPLDVLMVNQEGKIIQIIPQLVLANLTKEMYPPSPVLAIVFLKGGICEAMSIVPGDEINYKIFNKSPTVLNAPGTVIMQDPPSGTKHKAPKNNPQRF